MTDRTFIPPASWHHPLLVLDHVRPDTERRFNALLPDCAWPHRFIYLLWDASNALVYVGRTADVGRRLAQHRRKRRSWVQRVEAVDVVQVSADTLDEADRFAVKFEAFCISRANPEANISRPKQWVW